MAHINKISSFRTIIDEIRKVSWPSRRETIKLTIVVIVVSVFVGIYIGVLDIVFAKGLQLFTK
ncbi:MAG: preprotein translocase subunit SecE [Patescibacteria group bacterium]